MKTLKTGSFLLIYIKMEELFGALGIGGSSVGVMLYYIKNRILKYERKIDAMEKQLNDERSENKLQKEQIKELKEDFRDLKKMVYGKA